jgi:hypothetical protein
MDFKNAIKRPFTDIKKLIIGIILYALPILNIISSGYLLEILKTPYKKLPEWKGFGQLFINGLIILIVEIIYFIPLIILGIIGLALIGTERLTSFIVDNQFVLNSDQALALLISLWPLVLISILVLIFLAYLIPSAIISYSRNYKFKDAFKFKEIIKKAFTSKYLLAIILGLITNLILVWVVQLILYLFSYTGSNLLILILEPILGSIAGFISAIIIFTLLGETIEVKSGKKR